MQWPLAEAKQKFSEVIELAVANGPQFISKRGKETAVVMSAETYRALSDEHALDFKDYLLSGPSLEGLNLTRDQSLPKQIEL